MSLRPSHQTKSRLTDEEQKIMDEYEAYGEVDYVDLDNMPSVPIGDYNSPSYDIVSKKPGQLGGKRKIRKSRKMKKSRKSRKMKKSRKNNKRSNRKKTYKKRK
jgi:hypothetical protein